MKQITVSVPEKDYSFFLRLVKSLDFVKIKERKEMETDVNPKQKFLENLSEAVKEVKLIKSGKLKGISAKQLLNEL